MNDYGFGNKIYSLRNKFKMSQGELGKLVGVSNKAVSKWENDLTCPDISILPELAKILGVSIDELLIGKKEEAKVVSIVPEEKRKDISELMLRIVIESVDGDKVKINLPMALIEAAINMGIEIPEVSGKVNLNNIDFNKILELVKKGAVGNLVEVESSDGDTVKIFVE